MRGLPLEVVLRYFALSSPYWPGYRKNPFAIRESRMWNIAMNLKPQDVVVALKLCAYPDARPAMSVIANDLSLRPSEVHGAIGRLRASRLLHGPNLKDRHCAILAGISFWP